MDERERGHRPRRRERSRVALQKRGRLQREQPGDHHILRIGPQCTRAHGKRDHACESRQARPRTTAREQDVQQRRPRCQQSGGAPHHPPLRHAGHAPLPPNDGEPHREPRQQHRQHLQREACLARRVRQQGDHASQAPRACRKHVPHARVPRTDALRQPQRGKRRACARAEEQGRRQQRGQQSALFQRMRDRRSPRHPEPQQRQSCSAAARAHRSAFNPGAPRALVPLCHMPSKNMQPV